jgi:hypothetical protein
MPLWGGRSRRIISQTGSYPLPAASTSLCGGDLDPLQPPMPVR